MKFNHVDEWAIDKALDELFSMGGPVGDYRAARASIKRLKDGIEVSEDTRGGRWLADLICEILFHEEWWDE